MSLLHKLLMFIVLSCFYPCLQAADLFGNVEIDMAKQEASYKQLFGDEDAAAKSSKLKLQLAYKLDAKLEEPDFNHIQAYMCKRILELLGKDKAWSAYHIRLHVFDIQHPDGVHSQAQAKHLLGILEKALPKAPPAEKSDLVERMIAVHTDNLRFAIFNNDMTLANNSAKALDKLLKKNDPKAAKENKIYLSAIKERQRSEKSFNKLKQSAEAAESAAKMEEFAYFCFETSRFDEGLPVAKALHEKHNNAFPHLLLSEYQHLKNKEPVDIANAVNTVLGISRLLKTTEPSIFMDARLLNTGLGLMKIIEQDDGFDKQMKLRCKLASESWQQRLDARGLLIEKISSLAVRKSSGKRISRSGSGGTMRLGKGDIVDLCMPKSFFWGHYGTSMQPGITKGLKPSEAPRFRQGSSDDMSLWYGSSKPVIHNPANYSVVMVCRSTIAGHADRIDQFALDGLKAMYKQFEGHEDKLILMTVPMMTERDVDMINAEGSRNLAAKQFNNILHKFAQEHKVPVIDVYALCEEKHRKDKTVRFIYTPHATKVTQAGCDVVIEAIRKFFGYE